MGAAMSSNACTADNVIGKLISMRDANGHGVGLNVLSEIDNGGKASMVNHQNQLKAEVLDEAGGDETFKSPTWWGGPEILDLSKGVVSDQRNPSGLFGEDMVKPVIDFVTDHHANNYEDLGAARGDYMSGIRDVFDSIDTSQLSEAQQKAWGKFQRYYESGGELYNRQGQNSTGQKAVSNLTTNIIKSSPRVIIGNVLEGTIKLPTLYPKTFMQGMAQAVQQGIFKEHPDLKAKGIYGQFIAGEKLGSWEGLIGLTDVPLKNIAYFAGELADGDGAKAVQRVAFTPRFGDLPAQYYSQGGKGMVTLLSYTVNSYKMYSSLWQEAMSGNLQPLVTYHALTALIGGAASGIPAPVIGLIETVFPDSQQWFEENQNSLSSMIQPGNIRGIGVGYDIANRQAQTIAKNIDSISYKSQNGDYTGAALDSAETLLGLTAFTGSPVGDLNFQKVIRLSKDVATGELNVEELPYAAADSFGVEEPVMQLMELGR